MRVEWCNAQTLYMIATILESEVPKEFDMIKGDISEGEVTLATV